jgi:signal transduction histidine kinase
MPDHSGNRYLGKIAIIKKNDSSQEQAARQKIVQIIKIVSFNMMRYFFYYWLKAESQNPLLINQSSNQRDLP